MAQASNQAYIVDALRSPTGKRKGGLSHVHAIDLGAHVLKALVEEHRMRTDSVWAATLLDDWDRWVGRFWQVCPKEMVNRLSHPLSDAVAEVVALIEPLAQSWKDIRGQVAKGV